MNIFYLDRSPLLAARYHTDKHVVKMPLEAAQVLCTVARLRLGTKTKLTAPDGKARTVYLLPNETFYFEKILVKNVAKYKLILSTGIYVQTHINSPSVLWVNFRWEHFQFLHHLCHELNNEYVHRYNHGNHKSYEKLKELDLLNKLVKVMPVNCAFNPPPQVMPDEYKREDTVEAYRAYYAGGKQHLHKWTNRDIPEWLK